MPSLVVAWFLAQDTGVSASPDFQIIEFIARLGVTGLLAGGYWLERRERLASQERERRNHDAQTAMLERMLPIITEATSTLDKVTEAQDALSERTNPAALLEQMNNLVQELRAQRRGG